MAENTQMAAESRTEFGKGAARKLRVAGKVPAVVYGHGEEPQHVSLPAHEMMLAARRANALLELGPGGGNLIGAMRGARVFSVFVSVARRGMRGGAEGAVCWDEP